MAEEKIRKGKIRFIRDGLQICFGASQQPAKEESDQLRNLQSLKQKKRLCKEIIIAYIEARKNFSCVPS